jgi:Zinc-finger of C2H2 type
MEESFAMNEDGLDDAIRKLEAKLKDDNSTSSSNKDSSDDETNGNNEEHHAREGNRNTFILTSDISQNERIERLPEEYLPKIKKRTLKGIDDDNGNNTNNNSKSQRKNIKKKKANKGKNGNGTDENDVTDEIKAKVQNILGNYQPRSALERLPFYCRYCSKQCGTTEEEFFAHMETVFHKTAVAMERKASFCKLCQKQLTSPIQLKEHLQSKPHRNRLQMLKQKQSNRQPSWKRT